MSVDQTLLIVIVAGALVAILYSLRYLVLLERRMVRMEAALQKMVGKVEFDERKILLEEHLIERAVIKKKK